MKQEGRMRGIRTDLARRGSLYCEDCGAYLGELHFEAAKSVYLHILCRCGNSGYLEQGERTTDKQPVVADRWPDAICCRDCETLIFTLSEDVRGVSLSAECTCGLWMEGDYQRKRRLYPVEKRLT